MTFATTNATFNKAMEEMISSIKSNPFSSKEAKTAPEEWFYELGKAYGPQMDCWHVNTNRYDVETSLDEEGTAFCSWCGQKVHGRINLRQIVTDKYLFKIGDYVLQAKYGERFALQISTGVFIPEWHLGEYEIEV